MTDSQTVNIEQLLAAIPTVDPLADLKARLRACNKPGCGKTIVFENVETWRTGADGQALFIINMDGSSSGVPLMDVTRVPRDVVRLADGSFEVSKKGHDCPARTTK